MNNMLKMQWHHKTVKVALCATFMASMSDRTLNLKITVEETTLLPSSFARGRAMKANADIINTIGGLRLYIKKILDSAAKKEHQRRNQPIKQQLTLGL